MKDDKEKKSKQRFLSPSFKRGVVKETKNEEDDGEFKLNLICAADPDFDDDDESKSPSPSKHRGAKRSTKTSDEISTKTNITTVKPEHEHKHHHHGDQPITEDMKTNSLKNVKFYLYRS